MTPIAHALVADSIKPKKERQYGDLANRLKLLDGLHFFEVTAIYEAAKAISEKVGEAVLGGHDDRAFLPAPRIMMEFAISDPAMPLVARQAFIVEERRDGFADVTLILKYGDGRIVSSNGVIAVIPMRGKCQTKEVFINKKHLSMDADTASAIACCIYALLAMINTPRIIGRRSRMPHAGLQRKIAALHGMPGKYPIQAWQEMLLEVTPPRDEAGHGERKTCLTGGKALHFVRSYLRIRAGKLELVSSHWKGDPALGVKQTRYRVIPSKNPLTRCQRSGSH